MPFVSRRVEPLHLSNRVLPRGCNTELGNVSNNTLANLVRQLADIADHATGIFDEICCEARDIYDRSCRLRDRAESLVEYMNTLDARAVEVPVSTLSDFKTLTDHYRYRSAVQDNLITPASRPQCIELQYCKASTNLKDIFEKLKEYHEDEVTVCNLCQSISLSRLNCDTDSSEYDIEFPRPAVYESNEQRRRKPLLSYTKLPTRPRSEGDLLDDYVPPNRGTLPTPEEIMRRNVTQSMVINVDTSGTGFERMQTFRRSLTSMGRKIEKAKRKGWRRTISGIPDEIQAELQTESAGEGDGRSTDQENDMVTLKTMSLDRRSFRQVKPLESPAARLAVVTPIRTRRRPRSLRLPGPNIFPGFQQWRENHHQSKHDKKQEAKAGGRDRHSVALPVQSNVPTPSPSQGYSSCSDDKTWPGPAGRRPQSLALPSSTVPQSQAPLVPLSSAQPSNKKLYVTSNRTVPNAVIPTKSVTMMINMRKTSGSGDAHDGFPLHELQARLPSTKVKLRNSKPTAKREDRQSSSGNWSGTDSARTSMNSDIGNSLNYDFLSSTTTSPSDSAVSLSSENLSFPKFNGCLKGLDRKHSRGKSDRPGSHTYTSTGESSSESSTPTNSPNVVHSGFTHMDTDSWLQSVGAATVRRMPPEAGNIAPARKSPKGQCEIIFTSDTHSDSSSSSENPASSSAMSDNSSIDLEVCLADINSDFVDSDSTSGHSVDHEGYWTSMHSDCGLPNRRIKKRKSSLTKEPLPIHLRNEPSLVQPKAKMTLLAIAAPVVPVPTNQKRKAPPPPIRIDSVALDQSFIIQHKDKIQIKGGGHKSTSLLLPSSYQDDNCSTSPSSLTDTASEASTIGSDNTTTPTPIQTPTDPAMYQLCFGGSSKSLESLDSQMSGSQGSQPSRIDAWTTEVSRSFSANKQATSVLVPPIQEQASVAKFRPQVIQPSSSVLPKVLQAQPLTLSQPAVAKNSPTHEGKIKMLNARNMFFGISREESTVNHGTAGDPISVVTNFDEQTLQDETLESEEMSPIGVYPEKYHTLKRRPKHEMDTLKKSVGKQNQESSKSVLLSEDMPVSKVLFSDEQSEGSISEEMTVASQAKKGMDTLQRKRFQDYVSSVQSQAPQNYNSINSVKESGSGNGTQALTREQREEILNMLRRTKNNKVASSPTLPEPSSKKFEDPAKHELGRIHENVAVQEQVRQQDKESGVKTSFRSTYHVSVESDNLDPDLAIIRAAEQMEQQLLQKRQRANVPSPFQSEDDNIWVSNAQPFTRNSVAYRSMYNTDSCGNSFSHIPSMDMDDSYVYDPDLKPKSSILKVRKQGDAPLNGTKSNGTMHLSMPLGRHGQAMSPTDSVSSLNSIRSITFSDMVDVEHTPVKICLPSGKPQTPMNDFKMLLQQHSSPRRGQSACSALNVQPKSPRPSNNAELLYSGIRTGAIQEEGAKAQESNPEVRKIVSMKDLRSAMANPRTNSRTGDLGLPYEELQAQNRQKSPKNSPCPSPNSTLTKEDKGGKFYFKQPYEVDSNATAGNSVDSGRVKSLPNGNMTNADQSRQLLTTGEKKDLGANNQGIRSSLNEQKENKTVLKSHLGSDPGAEQTSSNVKAVKPQLESISTLGDKTQASLSKRVESVKNSLYLTSRILPQLTESASDSILSRKDMMDEIRRRGTRRDSRQEAVSELETRQMQRKLSASSMPSLETGSAAKASGARKGLGSLLDSMKTALKSMAVASPTGDGEHENNSGAWE